VFRKEKEDQKENNNNVSRKKDSCETVSTIPGDEEIVDLPISSKVQDEVISDETSKVNFEKDEKNVTLNSELSSFIATSSSSPILASSLNSSDSPSSSDNPSISDIPFISDSPDSPKPLEHISSVKSSDSFISLDSSQSDEKSDTSHNLTVLDPSLSSHDSSHYEDSEEHSDGDNKLPSYVEEDDSGNGGNICEDNRLSSETVNTDYLSASGIEPDLAPDIKEQAEAEGQQKKGSTLSSSDSDLIVGSNERPFSREEKQFRLVKYFSNVSILVIFASCLIIAAVMSGQAEDIIYDRVVEDTIMIMDNLNFQMYNHFLLPIYRERGQAKLSEPDAYAFLNTVIQNTVYGFDISRVALYDSMYGMMVYSSDSLTPVVVYRVSPLTGEQIPSGSFANPISSYLEAITRAYLPPPHDLIQSFFEEEIYPRALWRAIGDEFDRAEYLQYLKERTVILREEGDYLLGGFFPKGQFSIRCFKAMEDYYSPNISGVLEITRDVSSEYRQIAAMQYVALAIAIGASIFLTFSLRLVVARGEAIIHQRNAEKALLSERLNQAERLVNVGRMVATVSHEIRNPLGIINSSADFLSGSLKEHPNLQRLAKAIVDESDRLSRVVTDFLDFSRPQKLKFAEVIVEELLEETLVLLEVDMSRAGVELKVDLRQEQTPILADGVLLHRAFSNILLNAIQAMPDGGLLTVTTVLDQKRVLFKDNMGHLIINIIDTGPGITQEALSNLFKPFFTTKAKGTGLGLVLVRNIIESHGGSLEFRNITGEEEHGLKVTISLPISQNL
jgi:signal transduction histidine kinase